MVDIYCHAKTDGRVVIDRVDHELTVSYKEPVQLDDIQNSIPSLAGAILLDIPDNQILFFWADSANFKVERDPERNVHVPGEPCRILDSNHGLVGETGCMLSEHYDENGCDSGEWEFIAISRRKLLHFEAHITVIQIRRHHGIAYRMNIGEISESAWNDAKPTSLLIALG